MTRVSNSGENLGWKILDLSEVKKSYLFYVTIFNILRKFIMLWKTWEDGADFVVSVKYFISIFQCSFLQGQKQITLKRDYSVNCRELLVFFNSISRKSKYKGEKCFPGKKPVRILLKQARLQQHLISGDFSSREKQRETQQQE